MLHTPDHHLFLSYARKDNTPRGGAGTGWVSAFHAHLQKVHAQYSGRPLNIFFDKESIPGDAYWRSQILSGLKTSRLMLAFLSPNYIASKYCRWEWEEYLRLEHTLARGEAGIKQVYFVKVPELEGEAAGDEALETWLEDMRARNRDEGLDLRDWFDAGPDELLRLDAAERLADLEAGRDGGRGAPSLGARIARLDRSISERLDEALLAELAPGNIDRRYEGFVGRSNELRDLHRSLLNDRVGLIGALHGLGGQGKTALAVQYAYAYAGFYACGGRWQVPCEGETSLASLLSLLATDLGVTVPESPKTLSGPDADASLIKNLLEQFRTIAEAGKARVLADFAKQTERHTRDFDPDRLKPRMLIVLDNVDQPGLLSAGALAPLTNEDWLEVVVTTRLDPASLGDIRALEAISVDDLPEADALALLRNWRAFGSDDEEDAARAIVRRIGGFTLAVELIGAYLDARPSVSYHGYLQRLEREGVAGVDALSGDVTAALRSDARRRTIAAVTDVTLEELHGVGAVTRQMLLTTLELASFLPPDQIRTDWLRVVVASFHPELSEEALRPGHSDPWQDDLLPLLDGRRLLTRSTDSHEERPLARLHRMVGAHLQTLIADDRRAELLKRLVGLTEAVGTRLEQAVAVTPALRVHGPHLLAQTEALLRHAPNDLTLPRALGVCADIEFTQGILLRASDIMMDRHKISQRIANDNPESLEAARDLSLAQSSLGDFHIQRGQPGDSDKALAYFNASLETLQRILDNNPGSAQAARDLSVSQERLGSFHIRRGQPGDSDKALAYFNASLETDQRILDDNPGSAQAARDLSVAQNKLGDFHIQRGQPGDSDKALAYFNASLETRQRILDDNPESAQASRDLAVSQERLAQVHLQRKQAGDGERALGYLEKATASRQSVWDNNNGIAQLGQELARTLIQLGQGYVAMNREADAIAATARLQTHLQDMATRELDLGNLTPLFEQLKTLRDGPPSG